MDLAALDDEIDGVVGNDAGEALGDRAHSQLGAELVGFGFKTASRSVVTPPGGPGGMASGSVGL